ncbi:hypothetical protein EB796_003704 [Bugula neritina]|uniref:Uncharacterized protein n=1 Tax=Bugula neritina TaxID=10212 RepID=A0A7J7KH41_BUGNE|nr:hypothetical protein EB796_003704 [Bugula neritina]
MAFITENIMQQKNEVLSEHQTECEPLLRLLDEYENDKGKNSVFINPLPSMIPCHIKDEELNQLSKR